jgi:hypothetical protein
MYADDLLQPWLNRMLEEYPGVRLYDSHTHVGDNDPSGMSATFDELEAALRLCDARGAVFPLSEPDGYEESNRRCVEAAARSGGRFIAFVRVTPDERPVTLLAEGLEAGARGLKLHPASDSFSLADPRLADTWAMAEEHRLPVVVHAGPERTGIGETALALCDRHPGLRMVLAHCALPDLGWIGRELVDRPNLFFDTSWWGAAPVLALMRLVPPDRILAASDLPYSTPLSMALTVLRCAHQVGLGQDAVTSILGGQFHRLLDGEEPLQLGAAPQQERPGHGPIPEVLSTNLLAALEPMQRGLGPGVPLDVARTACNVPDDAPEAGVVASVARLIGLYDEQHERLPRRNQFTPGWDLIAAAATVARTPSAPVPAH